MTGIAYLERTIQLEIRKIEPKTETTIGVKRDPRYNQSVYSLVVPVAVVRNAFERTICLHGSLFLLTYPYFEIR